MWTDKDLRMFRITQRAKRTEIHFVLAFVSHSQGKSDFALSPESLAATGSLATRTDMLLEGEGQEW